VGRVKQLAEFGFGFGFGFGVGGELFVFVIVFVLPQTVSSTFCLLALHSLHCAQFALQTD